MAKQNRFNHNRKKPSRPARAPAAERPPIEIPVRKPPAVLGKPLTILEDGKQVTFQYLSGAWVPYAMTIAQCREEGAVKELPQKINNMKRYEVRLPLSFQA